jgi:hypothetical protein
VLLFFFSGPDLNLTHVVQYKLESTNYCYLQFQTCAKRGLYGIKIGGTS